MVPATPFEPNTTAIVHLNQMAMASGDFVGWGTAKGVGVDNCPTYTGTLWYIYVDGYAFGIYFCRQGNYGSLPPTADNQHFEILYTTCSGSTRWAFYWNSTLKTCQAVDGSHGTAYVGGESIGHDPQKIDVRDNGLVYHVSNWADWTASTTCTNTSFYHRVTSSATDISFLEN